MNSKLKPQVWISFCMYVLSRWIPNSSLPVFGFRSEKSIVLALMQVPSKLDTDWTLYDDKITLSTNCIILLCSISERFNESMAK